MTQYKQAITFFWLRRDLRLEDNAGLYQALKNHNNVLPIFIFDQTILNQLATDDKRVLFIHQTVAELKNNLQKIGSDLLVLQGDPVEIFKKLLHEYKIDVVYCNHDYEPKAILRDQKVKEICEDGAIQFLSYKDQCIFEKKEIVTDQQKPYTVFTPYKKKWLVSVSPFYLKSYPNGLYQHNYLKVTMPTEMLSLSDLNFVNTDFIFPEIQISSELLKSYTTKRDFPALEKATSHLGLHLRFGTVSVRELAREGLKYSEVWLSELIWRDFFMQVLWHHPFVVDRSFKPQFEKVNWRQNDEEFQRWCLGQTGYPMVDAGMRELNQTGYMHNRVRMVAASFLTKHLFMHWSLGEKYFASKLLDFDLSANNGNWQWAAGTGCDAAPYFRIFNPTTQLEKFDPQFAYVKKWVPEFDTNAYCKPLVDHVFARERALTEFKKVLSLNK